MCDNELIKGLIFDYIDGSLDDRSEAEVIAHLEVCADCRRREKEYHNLLAGLKAVYNKSASNHVSNDILIKYVDQPEILTEEIREDIELHLMLCPFCEQKVAMLRSIGEESLPDEVERTSAAITPVHKYKVRIAGNRALVGLAAAAIIIIAVAVTYWGGGAKEPRMQVTQTETTVWLHETVRGSGERPEFVKQAGHIEIGILFYAFFDEENYKIQLAPQKGAILSEIDVKQIDYNGRGIPLRIETSSLKPGEYQLILVTIKSGTQQEEPPAIYRFAIK